MQQPNNEISPFEPGVCEGEKYRKFIGCILIKYKHTKNSKNKRMKINKEDLQTF